MDGAGTANSDRDAAAAKDDTGTIDADGDNPLGNLSGSCADDLAGMAGGLDLGKDERRYVLSTMRELVRGDGLTFAEKMQVLNRMLCVLVIGVVGMSIILAFIYLAIISRQK